MTEFESFGAFSKHLLRIAAAGEEVAKKISADGAELIKDEAQVRIGMYQEAVGPFNAWAALADATVEDRISQGYTPFDPLLRKGDLRDSYKTSSDGTVSVAGSEMDIAFWQEVGTAEAKYPIPPRPVLGPAAIAMKPRVALAAVNTVVAWLMGKRWVKADQLIKLP